MASWERKISTSFKPLNVREMYVKEFGSIFSLIPNEEIILEYRWKVSQDNSEEIFGFAKFVATYCKLDYGASLEGDYVRLKIDKNFRDARMVISLGGWSYEQISIHCPTEMFYSKELLDILCK